MESYHRALWQVMRQPVDILNLCKLEKLGSAVFKQVYCLETYLYEYIFHILYSAPLIQIISYNELYFLSNMSASFCGEIQ